MSSAPAADRGPSPSDHPGAGHHSPDDDLRLAHLHLKLGQLTLARAELEDLAARDQLGLDGLATLAEARWRTGDGARAAEAARAHLDGGGTDEVAICIAVEAAAADGDLDAASALMHRLGPPDPELVDALFGGMPQRAFWPAAADPAAAGRDVPAAPGRPSAVPGPREVPAATPPGGPVAVPEAGRARRGRVDWNPGAELRRAREELGARPERAFVRFALVLRLDPTLAPGVIDALAMRREPAAAVLRGDAQRLLGRHLEAEAAFDAAAESLEAT